MTNLTFAIEAHKRGCPYVDNVFTYMRFKPSDPNSMAGTFYSLENATPYTCFIIGATLALWWEEQYSKEHEEFQSYPYHDNHKSELSRKCDECMKHRDDARSFAKGL